MSNSAELNAHHVISSAFVVGYTMVTTVVKPLTSVRIPVNFARHVYVGVFLETSTSHQYAVVSSALTCVAILANYREGEVA